MCFDHDSRPPVAPMAGGAGDSSDIVLTAADGARFAAFAARASQPSGAAVVLLPDVRGLHPYYQELALRFAEAGLDAVAIDYFGRTAGLCDTTGTRAEDFEFRPHVEATTDAGIDADLTAAIAELRRRTRPDLPVVTVGFCFGGSHSWRQSGGDLDVAACAGFYGRPVMVGGAASRASRPTLMLIAGADVATPVEDQLALAETMRAAGADVTTAVYDGAPHSFFDRAFGEWTEACDDAWRHLLALTDRVSLPAS